MIIEGTYTINAQSEKVWNTLKSFDNVEDYVPIVQKTEVEGSGVLIKSGGTLQVNS